MSSVNNKTSKLFGRKVKLARVRKNLSQEALSELCNLSRRTISTIETGDSVPSIETAANIARGLGIDLYKMFIFDDIE